MVQLISCDKERKKLWDDHDNVQENYPELFQMIWDSQNYPDDISWFENVANRPGYVEERQRRMHIAVWHMRVRAKIEEQLEAGQPTLIEGVAAYPELVAALPYTFHYVVMGTQEGQAEHMLRHARESSDSHNWMKTWSEERIRRYAELQADMSRRLQKEAEAFGFPYIEMSVGNYTERQEEALELLMSPDSFFRGPLTAH